MCRVACGCRLGCGADLTPVQGNSLKPFLNDRFFFDSRGQKKTTSTRGSQGTHQHTPYDQSSTPTMQDGVLKRRFLGVTTFTYFFCFVSEVLRPVSGPTSRGSLCDACHPISPFSTPGIVVTVGQLYSSTGHGRSLVHSLLVVAAHVVRAALRAAPPSGHACSQSQSAPLRLFPPGQRDSRSSPPGEGKLQAA